MDADERRYREISEQIIGAAIEVSNALGVEYLEKVYERAVFAELTMRGLLARQQQSIPVQYKGVLVGDYFADIVVADSVIIEIKHADGFDDVHRAQCLNYLKTTGFKLCLLINFGKPKVKWKRIVHNF